MSILNKLPRLAIQLRRSYHSSRQGRRNQAVITRQQHPFFANELKSLLNCDDDWLHETFTEYRDCRAAWHLLSGLHSADKSTDGFAKSLDVAEGFAVWAVVKHVKPTVVAELGVQYGISSRLWKEALKQYVPDHELILFDLDDKRRFIDDTECTFLCGDAYKLLPEVFKTRTIDLLHNDAHPYSLIDWSVREAIERNVKTFTFHDIGGKPPRNPFKLASINLSHEEKLANDTNWGQYGHWERHVVGTYFDENILHKNFVKNDKYIIQMFESLFGFGVVLTQGV